MATVYVEAAALPSARELLGGPDVLEAEPRWPLEWVEAVRRGFPAAAVDALTSSIGVTQSELAAALGIPARTLVRRKREGVLSSEESAKLLGLARVVERAAQVFQDEDAALDWLKSANAALAGLTPFSLLDTDIGVETVLDVLGRIEHGVIG
jgi:putative toxin-antitoxin system antitoxin component (TIGR02293 family)